MQPSSRSARHPMKMPGAFAVAPMAFLILFPGFFLYHTLVGIGAIGPFLGGYFSIASLALLLPLGFAYYLAVKSAAYRVAQTDLQFGFFLAYFLVVVGINAVFGGNAEQVRNHLQAILYFINIYVIFKYIDFSQKKTMSMTMLSLALMSLTIFYFSQGGSFQPGQGGASDSAESVVTYQGFARSYVLTFVAAICFTRRALARWALYAIAVAALFLNGARSELAVVVVLMPLIEVYRVRNGLQALCVVLLALIVAAVGPQNAMESLPDSRVWELFNLSQSESANARVDLTQTALQTIGENPVLGSYASYMPGGYAHNILSAWVNLGFFGFIYLLVMLVLAAVRLLVDGWRTKACSSQFLLAWSLICMSLLMLITAKSFDDMFVGAAMGAYANWRSRKSATGIGQAARSGT